MQVGIVFGEQTGFCLYTCIERMEVEVVFKFVRPSYVADSKRWKYR